MGRPTVMTTETLDKLREAFLMGFSDREACLYADIGLQTLYDYQKKDSDYSEQKDQYKLNPILKAKKIVYDELLKGNLKVSFWYLERKAREEFSLRSEYCTKPKLSNDELEMELDKLEKTNYDEFARQAQEQLDL